MDFLRGAKLAVLLAGLACGDDPTGAPRKLTGVWSGRLSSASGADSVRVVIDQYSDLLRGDAVFASGVPPRYAVVGSFIGTDVELDFTRLPAFGPGAPTEFLFRGTYLDRRIAGRVTGAGRDTSIVLAAWRPNVSGIQGTWVLATVDDAPAGDGSGAVHDTLVLRSDARLTRARVTPGLSYGIGGIYEPKGTSVLVRYLSPFSGSAIPERDSLVMRGSTLVRLTPAFDGGLVEETYRRLP